MNAAEKKLCLDRLARIEGQVGGILRMIENDRAVINIMEQMQSIHGALRSLENKVLGCAFADQIEQGRAGPEGDRRRQMKNLLDVVRWKLEP